MTKARHALALLTAIALVAMPAGITRHRARQSCHIGAKSVPSCGVYWGAYAPNGWQQLQSQIGRKLAIVHNYSRFPGTFPSANEVQASKQGSLLFVDWSVSAPLTWSDLADGSQDAGINREAAVLKAYGKPIMVSFQHEMDLAHRGTPADYVAAARHIYDVFRADGVRNVIWVWVTTGFTYDRLQRFYPGDSYVDWIMWDPYNWDGCNPHGSLGWRSFAEKVSPMYNWLRENSNASHDYLSKPWGLAEYGTVEGPTPSSKAKWFDAIPGDLARFPKLKALLYFNSQKLSGGRSCRWEVDTSAQSLQGFRTTGQDAAFRTMP